MPDAITLIEANSLRATPQGFEIQVRLNWYRSMPLSCVEKVRLGIDGEEIAAEAIWFQINAHQYSLQEMADKTGEYWFVQDSATLLVKEPGRIAPGEEHTIEAEITIRAPYILVGPEKFLTMPTKFTSVQVAR